jgi:heavy metal-(Cd/Co/Hg/Pb/Zn)-translocating P-type ATPase
MHDEEENCCRSGCACGENEEESEVSIREIVASLVFFVAGVLSEHIFHFPQPVIAVCFAVSIILAGWRVFKSGLESLRKLRLDENILMTVAVIAAFCIGEYFEAAMVAILFQLGELLEDKAVDHSRESIERLAEMRPDTARLFADGQEKSVSAETVQPGDVILVYPYERVPLDGTVIDGNSSLDASALTGESMPVDVSVGGEVLSGMMNEQSPLTIRVTNDFHNSAASRIIEMVEAASARKGNAEKLITRFAEVYTPIVIGMAVLLMALPPLFGLGEFTVWLYRALVFLVAACPCALVISVPLGFYAGIGAESKNGVLIKGGKYLEALSKADAVVFDKTGTLTSGRLSVGKVNTLENMTEEALLRLAASVEQYSAHPAAKAILTAAGDFEPVPVQSAEEIPGHGVSAFLDGKKILCGRRDLLEQDGIDLSGIEPASIYLSIDGKPVGSFVLSDVSRPDAAEGIEALKQLGINRIAMLTGDHLDSAAAAAAQCGITEYYADLLPEGKVDILEKIKAGGGTVVFVGDGINDAPVLAASDCGVAMGLGTDAAIEASDVVLTLDKPSRLAPAVRLARRAMGVIRANIIFALGLKAVVLILAALGYAPMWLAVFADVGVCVLSVMNATRILAFRT